MANETQTPPPSAPTEAEQRTAEAARKTNETVNKGAKAAGEAVVKGATVIKDGVVAGAEVVAEAASDPSSEAEKLKKKGKKFWENLDFSSILGAVGGLAGAWFLGNIFGDIFGGGFLSTILMIGLACLLVPAGMDIANGLFGDKKKSNVPLENQPQRFTAPQVQQLLEKADAPGMKHDVLQVIKVPGQKLTVAPVPEGATVPTNLLISRAKIEADMKLLGADPSVGHFFLHPKDDGSYDFGTIPANAKLRPQAEKAEKPEKAPRAHPRGKREGNVELAPDAPRSQGTATYIYHRRPQGQSLRVEDDSREQPQTQVTQGFSPEAMSAVMESVRTIRQANDQVDTQRVPDPQTLAPRNSGRDDVALIRT